MGTPNYMSPEQCRGGPVDGRSDLFSAGATLFEMVAGERAFPGHNVAEVSHRIQNEQIAAAAGACSRRGAAGCSWCSSAPWESSRRIVSIPADEMAEALRQVLGGSRGDETSSHACLADARCRRRPASQKSAGATPGRGTEPRLDADTLQALEHKLTGYVGPIARILVRTTAGRSRSVADLCSQLALSIADSAERERFRREVDLLIRSRSPVAAARRRPATGSGRSDRLPEQELERVQEALTQYRRTDCPRPGAACDGRRLVRRGSVAQPFKSHRLAG